MPILDALGKPAQYAPSSKGLYEDSQESSLRVSRPNLDSDALLLLSRTKFKAMLSDSRWIFTTFPLVSGAIEQKASYVSSNRWFPCFKGEDRDYEAKALPVLREHLKRATNKGQSFHNAWKQVIRQRHFDAAVFRVHARQRRTGRPITQFIEAHRIGNRTNRKFVEGGQYDGALMINGIIYSDDGREIAYNVLGPTREDDRQISVKDMQHVCSPRFFSENRPFPPIAYSILDWYDVKETRNFQKIKQKVNAALTLIEENDTGRNRNVNKVPGAQEQTISEASSGMRIETMEAGMIRYLMSKRGKLTPHESNTPGNNEQDFDRTVVNGAFYGMGWRSEMMDLSRLTGAGVRGFSDNINQAILDEHELISEFAIADFTFHISALTERGDLPEHPEWHKWEFPKPKRFDVDRLNTIKAQNEQIRIGTLSRWIAIEDAGGDPEQVIKSEAKYIRAQIAEAGDDLDPAELGTKSQPGDILAQKEAAASNQESDAT